MKIRKNSCGKYSYDKDLGPCFIFDDIQKLEKGVFNYWPNFSFILSNEYNFKWFSKNYFFNDTTKKTVRACMGFNHQLGKFTMGSTWMIGHEIIFDIINRKIGFVEAYCDKNNTNRSIDYFGVEDGYNSKNYEKISKKSFFDIFVNENMLGFYIFVTIILFFVIIYLIVVLINFKKRKKNPWIWFLRKDDYNQDESFIPLRFDVSDINERDIDKGKKIDMIFLDKEEKKSDFTNSKYSKITS